MRVHFQFAIVFINSLRSSHQFKLIIMKEITFLRVGEKNVDFPEYTELDSQGKDACDKLAETIARLSGLDITLKIMEKQEELK